MARTLVEPKETIPVRLANVTNEAQTFYPGTNVATISSVNEVQESLNKRQTYGSLPKHMHDLFDRASVGLSADDRNQVMKLLQKYSNIFSKHDTDLGRTGIIKHQIHTGDARPIKQPPRRVPVHMQSEVDDQLDHMLENDIIRPSTSPWASAIVLVNKKDGSLRFCIDYRRLNEVTTKDAYPLPRVDESLDQLSGATWFSCVDLSSGYWQVEMSEQEKPKTAFASRRGLIEFNFMPFGLATRPLHLSA